MISEYIGTDGTVEHPGGIQNLILKVPSSSPRCPTSQHYSLDLYSFGIPDSLFVLQIYSGSFREYLGSNFPKRSNEPYYSFPDSNLERLIGVMLGPSTAGLPTYVFNPCFIAGVCKR